MPVTGTERQDGAAGWVNQLESALLPFTKGMHSKAAADGALELFCTMPDPAAFGSAPANLAGLGYQAKAAGNRITITREGLTVRILLQHGGLVSPDPAIS